MATRPRGLDGLDDLLRGGADSFGQLLDGWGAPEPTRQLLRGSGHG